MQTLFAITLLCFAGILLAALAFARHIKAGRLRANASSSPQQDFRHHFLTVPAELPDPAPARSIRPGVLNQSVHDIAANKQFTLPPHATRIHRLPLRTVAAAVASVPAPPAAPPPRKPPQPARHGRLELIDPAYFNQNMGDLSDPAPSNNPRVNDRITINRY